MRSGFITVLSTVQYPIMVQVWNVYVVMHREAIKHQKTWESFLSALSLPSRKQWTSYNSDCTIPKLTLTSRVTSTLQSAKSIYIYIYNQASEFRMEDISVQKKKMPLLWIILPRQMAGRNKRTEEKYTDSLSVRWCSQMRANVVMIA